jgi:hypothetical protein
VVVGGTVVGGTVVGGTGTVVGGTVVVVVFECLPPRGSQPQKTRRGDAPAKPTLLPNKAAKIRTVNATKGNRFVCTGFPRQCPQDSNTEP